MRRIGIGGNRMIESKVIEKFMEENGLEPYDAFDVDGELKKYSPCYFTEELELRSMYLDFEGVDLPLCTIWLHRLLTGKDHVKQKRTKDNNSEVVAEEKRNVVCKVSVKGYVMSDEELDCLKKACVLASFVSSDKSTRIGCKKLHKSLVTVERS